MSGVEDHERGLNQLLVGTLHDQLLSGIGGVRDGVHVTVEVRPLHLDQRLLKTLTRWPEDTEH